MRYKPIENFVENGTVSLIWFYSCLMVGAAWVSTILTLWKFFVTVFNLKLWSISWIFYAEDLCSCFSSRTDSARSCVLVHLVVVSWDCVLTHPFLHQNRLMFWFHKFLGWKRFLPKFLNKNNVNKWAEGWPGLYYSIKSLQALQLQPICIALYIIWITVCLHKLLRLRK